MIKTPEKREADRRLSEICATLAAASATIPDLGAGEPGPDDLPPWPRIQMTIMYRYLATAAGMPRRCTEPRCRRKGVCHGGVGADQCHACEPQWDDAALAGLEAAFLALALGHCWEHTRKQVQLEWS